MVASYNIILSLLRLALWNEPFTGVLSKEEFSQVMNLAKEQTVYGLIFDAISQLNGKYDKRQVLEAYGRIEKIKRQNELVSKKLQDIARIFAQDEVDYIIVKGQVIGKFYPKPNMRMSGDIDFLIHQEYNAVKEVIEKRFSVNLPDRMIEREVGFKHEKVLYELHTNLLQWAKRRHQDVWDSLMEKEWEKNYYEEIDGVKVRTLTPTLNAAYVFIHLFFHFIREGVSLRQFCDWAIVLRHYKNEIDKDELSEILINLDVYDAYCAFGTILTGHLGLSVEDFPLPLRENDKKWQDILLNDIFKGGNFGKLNHQSHHSLGFKMETMRLSLRNTFRYYKLCPSEIGGLIPRLVKRNLKIFFCKAKN